jgi:photosystem II stability/assembly factor-like uncharacterized protein
MMLEKPQKPLSLIHSITENGSVGEGRMYYRVVNRLLLSLVVLFLGLSVLAGENRWSYIGPPGISVVSLAVDPGMHNVVYAACTNGLVGFNYRSLDSGLSWSPVQISGLSYPLVSRWLVPSGKIGVVYAQVRQQLFRSSDHGVTWSSIEIKDSLGRGIEPVTMVLKPGGETVYVAGKISGDDKQPVFCRVQAAGSVVETVALSGQPVTVAADERQPNTVYLRVENDGLWKSTDAGTNWRQLAPEGILSSRLFVNPYTSRVHLGWLYSDDGGETWKTMKTPTTVWGSSGIIAMAANPVSPNTLYLSGNGESLWKTSDDGQTWTRIPVGTAGDAASVTQIVITSSMSPRHWLLGTRYSGIFRSIDEGQTWSTSAEGIPCGTRVTDLAVGFEEGNQRGTLYATTEWGAFKRIGERSWQPINEGIPAFTYAPVFSIAADPVLPGGLYAGAQGLYRSWDGGRRWHRFQPGGKIVDLIPHPEEVGRVYSLESSSYWQWGSFETLGIDASNPSVVYRATELRLEKSSDGGVSWSTSLNHPVHSVAVDPSDARRIYAGSAYDGILKTTDNGKTWFKSGWSGPIYSLAVDPLRPNIVYAGYRGGVCRSTDFGATWLELDHAGMSEEIHEVVIDPIDPRTVYAGGLRGGVFEIRVTDVPMTGPLVTWPNRPTRWGAGAIHAIHWAPTGRFGRVSIEYSLDGGATFENIVETANTGSYAWTVPAGRQSDNCVIRVSEIGGSSDVSDRPFSISPCIYVAEPTLQEFDALGGPGLFVLFVDGLDGPCDCSLETDANWITLGTRVSATGRQTIGFNVQPNVQGESRSGKVRVGPIEVVVRQDGNQYFSSGASSLVFPIFRQDSDNFTGISITGYFPEVPLQFDAFGSDGNHLSLPSNPTLGQIESPGIFTRLGNEILGAGSGSESGWLRVLSAENVRLKGLFLTGNPERMDGGLATSRPVSRLIFPRVAEGAGAFHGASARTWISVVNPGEAAVTVRLSLHDPSASLSVREVSRTLAPQECVQGSLVELFGACIEFGYLVVESADGVSGLAGYALIELPDALISLAPFSEDVINKSPFWYYSPQFVVSPDLFSEVQLVNPNDRDVLVMLRWTDDFGQLVAPTVSFNLPAGSAYRKTAEEIFAVSATQLVVGSLAVSATGGIAGDVVFGDRHLRTAASVQLSSHVRRLGFHHVANGLGCYTGLAIYNPMTTSSQSVRIEVYSTEGEQTAQTVVDLGPGERRALLVDEWCPATRGQIGGYIQIDSDYGIAVQELFGNGLFLAAVPPTER